MAPQICTADLIGVPAFVQEADSGVVEFPVAGFVQRHGKVSHTAAV